MKIVAIIVGAGKGKRLFGECKSFILLKNKPILWYSLNEFSKVVDEIIVVAPKEAEEIVKEFSKVKEVVQGGDSRQESILNGLNIIKNADIVLVHDAARPLISEELIKNCIKGAIEYGAVIPAIPSKNTIKTGKEYVNETLKRDELNIIQTPQAFKFDILKNAYKKAEEIATDDSSLVEAIGHKVKIIEGEENNFKITTITDLLLAETILNKTITVKAYAKINLTLDILGKREDGYHNLRSIFQAVDIYDIITISEFEKFELLGSIDCLEEENLVTKSWQAIKGITKKELPCRIQLNKSLPISAGLGGGSSDAAATIVGLNKFFNLNLSKEVLLDIGKQVGADVPYFIANNGTALVEGIGEKITKHNVDLLLYYLLARPHKRVSTPEMFKKHNETGESFHEIAKREVQDVDMIGKLFSQHTNQWGMTGSGPTMFAGFDNYNKAKLVYNILFERKFNGDLFLVKPIDRTYNFI